MWAHYLLFPCFSEKRKNFLVRLAPDVVIFDYSILFFSYISVSPVSFFFLDMFSASDSFSTFPLPTSHPQPRWYNHILLRFLIKSLASISSLQPHWAYLHLTSSLWNANLRIILLFTLLIWHSFLHQQCSETPFPHSAFIIFLNTDYMLSYM